MPNKCFPENQNVDLFKRDTTPSFLVERVIFDVIGGLLTEHLTYYLFMKKYGNNMRVECFFLNKPTLPWTKQFLITPTEICSLKHDLFSMFMVSSSQILF